MKIGILYSSRYGFTEKLSRDLGQSFDDYVCLSIEETTDALIKSCDGIILATSVYSGKLRKNMINFINENKELLMSKKVGMFLTSFNDFKTSNYLEQSLTKGFINHLTYLTYGGYGYDKSQLSMLDKIAVKTIRKRERETFFENNEGLNTLVEKMK